MSQERVTRVKEYLEVMPSLVELAHEVYKAVSDKVGNELEPLFGEPSPHPTVVHVV